MCTHIFPKSENLTLTVVLEYSYVISSSCTFLYKYKPLNERMRTPVIIKSTNAFSSFIKMKFCSNLKDTMYFLSVLPSPEQWCSQETK